LDRDHDTRRAGSDIFALWILAIKVSKRVTAAVKEDDHGKLGVE